MAEANIFWQALVCLGLTANAANKFIHAETIDSYSDIVQLTNDVITDICKRIRKTGGNNKDGIPIPFDAKKMLKLACHYVRFVSRHPALKTLR